MDLFPAKATIRAEPSPDALDEAEIERLRSSLGEEADAIIALFITETASRLTRMASLGGADQRTTLGREAHSLKSAAATFGCHALANLALALEEDAKTLDAVSLLARVAVLSQTFNAARTALLDKPN
jgi:hypothetical protein